jgi:hypothetical protein
MMPPGIFVRACGDIAVERARQVTEENYSLAHDDAHTHAELARAAGSFVLLAAADSALLPHEIRKAAANLWPFEDVDLREKRSARRMLVIAGALIIAEIERLDRRSKTEGGT